MHKLEQIKKNPDAVSSVVGEVLITGIIVVVLSSVFLVLNSIDPPANNVHVSVEEWVDNSSSTIYLRHTGGEAIDVDDLRIDVNVNGKSYVYSQANISKSINKSQWELADTIKINTYNTWGFSLPNENDVAVKLIELRSREVLPKYRVST